MTQTQASTPDQPLENLPNSPSVSESTGALTSEETDEFFEWDETPTSLFLRALFSLVAGAGLSWAVWHSNIHPGQDFSRWVWLAGVANLVLPVGIIFFFFAQDFVHRPQLKNQAINAWNFGWNFRDFKTHAKWALGLTAAMLPFLVFASRDPSTRSAYSQWFPINADMNTFLLSLLLLGIYMFCWEFFHRGFLLFGMAQGFTFIPAIVLQAVLFGLAHWGKPTLELYGAFGGGLILGALAWRQKSFAVPFYTHYLVHLIWVLLLRF